MLHWFFVDICTSSFILFTTHFIKKETLPFYVHIFVSRDYLHYDEKLGSLGNVGQKTK